MSSPTFDYPSRWQSAATLMERDGIDAMFVMKPANLTAGDVAQVHFARTSASAWKIPCG